MFFVGRHVRSAAAPPAYSEETTNIAHARKSGFRVTGSHARRGVRKRHCKGLGLSS
jgi:hypothetical protein